VTTRLLHTRLDWHYAAMLQDNQSVAGDITLCIKQEA